MKNAPRTTSKGLSEEGIRIAGTTRALGLGVRVGEGVGTMTAPLAKGWAISENPVFGTWLVRIEAGLLLTYAKVTGPGAPFW